MKQAYLILVSLSLLFLSSCEGNNQNGVAGNWQGYWIQTGGTSKSADFYEVGESLIKMYNYADKVLRYDSITQHSEWVDTVPYWELGYIRRYDYEKKENFLTIYDGFVVNYWTEWKDANHVKLTQFNSESHYIELQRTTKNKSMEDYKKYSNAEE